MLASQFHIYLLWVNICLAKCLKYDSASRPFQPGEGPKRGLLRDCENFADSSFAALFFSKHFTASGHEMQCVSTAAQLFSATYAAVFRLNGEEDKASVVEIVNNWLV